MRIRCIAFACNLLAACAPVVRAPPLPAAAPIATEHLRIAVLGGIADGDPAVIARITADAASWEPDVVLFTGGAVTRSTARRWEEAAAKLAPLADRPWIAAPGIADGRGDPRLRGFGALWPLPDRRSVDLTVDGQIWRVVLLDARPGAATVEQAFWLPKVAGPAAVYDHLIAVAGAPARTALRDAPVGTTAGLVELAGECSDGRLRLVATGGAGANELFLPGGPWGELTLGAGDAGGGGALVDDAALDATPLPWAMAIRLDRQRSHEEAAPIRGWWAVELSGADAAVTFVRWSPDDVLGANARATWSALSGWRVVPVEPEPR